MQDWATRRRAVEDSRYLVSRAGPYGRWRQRAFKVVVTVLDGMLRLTPIYALGLRNALDLRKVELEFELPGLPPAFDGYRILQLSDTHLDHLPELVAAARVLLEGVEVDMLAVTGDIHGHPRAPIERSTALLMEALAGVRVRGPRLAVLGNHDAATTACASPDWTTSTASIPRQHWQRSVSTPASSASPWCIPRRSPTMPTPRATRSISAAIRTAARSACPAAARWSPISSAAGMPRAACGDRAGWSATPAAASA